MIDDSTLAAFAREAADAVIICDRSGDITFWNASAERLFGWPSDSVVGATLDVIIPERHRARHWEAFHAAIARGTTKYADELLQVPAEHHDGTRLSIAFTVTLLRDAGGEITGIASVVRDETAARRERLALEQQVRELRA